MQHIIGIGVVEDRDGPVMFLNSRQYDMADAHHLGQHFRKSSIVVLPHPLDARPFPVPKWKAGKSDINEANLRLVSNLFVDQFAISKSLTFHCMYSLWDISLDHTAEAAVGHKKWRTACLDGFLREIAKHQEVNSKLKFHVLEFPELPLAGMPHIALQEKWVPLFWPILWH